MIIDGRKVDEPMAIKQGAVSYFQKIFQENHNIRPTFTRLAFRTLNNEKIKHLTDPFSHSEIDAAVQSCDGDKSPGPDGFNFKFIKSSWDIIKGDIYDLVAKFWASASLPRNCNTAFIALLPKVENPEVFKDFRPISIYGRLHLQNHHKATLKAPPIRDESSNWLHSILVY